MKKQIRAVTQGMVQITTVDERWYARPKANPETGLPMYDYVPSVTWIADHYPKGTGFYKWLAQTGWDESQALKEAAGDKGSKVHYAIKDLLDGKAVDMDAPYLNPSTEQLEPLMLEEYECIKSFADWHTAANPKLIAQDVTVWNDEDGYAGTVDAVFEIGGVLYIVDFKTSKSIWPSHRIQVSAYKQAAPVWKDAKLAILQLGYKLNKAGYKFTPVEDCYDLFLAAKRIWAEEAKGQQPSQKDYPLKLQLTLPAEATTSPTTPGGTDGTDDRRGETNGVRTGHGGRMVDGQNRGRAVRPQAQTKAAE